jgi:hypothetical protein
LAVLLTDDQNLMCDEHSLPGGYKRVGQEFRRKLISKRGSAMRKFGLLSLLMLFIYTPIHAQTTAGTALQFDGIDDWVEIPDSPSLNPTDQITVEVWAYSDVFDRSQWQEFVMKGGNSAPSEPRQYYIRPYNYEGTVQFLLHDSLDNTYRESSDTMLTNGKWYHIAGTYDGNVLKIYVNGNLEGIDSAGTFQIVQSTEVLAFARLGSIDAEYYQGKLDEIRIWNIARGQAQLRSTMNDTLGPEYYSTSDSGLVGYWRFDEGSDTTAFDLTGNHNDGIIHGAVYVPSGALVAIKSPQDNLPISIELYQNYPNPFNPTTNFEYRISGSGFVSLKVYDINGREVAVLANEQMPAGEYTTQWDAEGFASGIYFSRLQFDGFSQTMKMILMK